MDEVRPDKWACPLHTPIAVEEWDFTGHTADNLSWISYPSE